MDVTSELAQGEHVHSNMPAQNWGRLAVAFIFSGTAAGIFAVLSWFLSKAAAWAVLPFQVLAGVCLAIFLIASVNIVKWWIVLARRAKRIV